MLANKSKIANKLQIIKKIENIRKNNNVNWMNILRVAFKYDPDAAVIMFQYSTVALKHISYTKILELTHDESIFNDINNPTVKDIFNTC